MLVVNTSRELSGSYNNNYYVLVQVVAPCYVCPGGRASGNAGAAGYLRSPAGVYIKPLLRHVCGDDWMPNSEKENYRPFFPTEIAERQPEE